MSNSKGSVFRSDGDGHWYYIPVERSEEFSYWVESFDENTDIYLFDEFSCDDPENYVFYTPITELKKEKDFEQK